MKNLITINVFLCAMFFSATTLFTSASATPNISLGGNPVWAVGGTKSTGIQTVSVITAPTDQDLLITDVVFSITGFGNSATSCVATITLQDSSGNVLGAYQIASRDNVNYGGGITPSNISHSYRAGLPIYAGTTLDMVTNVSCGSFSFSVSGLHVQP